MIIVINNYILMEDETMENTILTEGIKAPDFTLMGSDQQEHKLSDYLGKKVILYFYPRDNTPGCSRQAQDFKEFSDKFNEQNTIILGVSRDSLASHDKFIAKYELPFLLLSDKEEVVCNLYNVLKEKVVCGKRGIGIERSTFIIDEQGILSQIHRKVKVAGHVEGLVCNL